jgi:hypothetical protein
MESLPQTDDRALARPGRDCWWMRAGDSAVRVAWKLLWSWRR